MTINRWAARADSNRSTFEGKSCVMDDMTTEDLLALFVFMVVLIPAALWIVAEYAK